MSHNATPNTSRVELRKTLTLVPVVMMGLAYMQPCVSSHRYCNCLRTLKEGL
ncbi:hypothetical protein QIG07_06885, partial [Klebsiella pneumoniae]|nr:hypothetical protein [Klebsiella pneumoniae]